MDIISQLQEQANTISSLAFNTFGTLQRDAPPVRLSPNYPEPPAIPSENAAEIADQPKSMSVSLVKAAKQFDALVAALPVAEGGEEAQLSRIAELLAENDAVGHELEKQLEAAGLMFFVHWRLCKMSNKRAHIFLYTIRMSESISLETTNLVKEEELKQVQELFKEATDICLNRNIPD